jgi:hypothetical protein
MEAENLIRYHCPERTWKCLVGTCRVLLLFHYYSPRLKRHVSKGLKQMRYFHPGHCARKQIVSPIRWAIMALVAVTLFATSGLLSAQTNGTGAVSGSITDPSSAVVAGALVKVTNVDTGETRSTITTSQGAYRVTLLPPGQYTLEVTKQGFKLAASTDVQVIVAETTVLNVKMEMGTLAQTVTIETSTVDLETESSVLGRVTDADMVENLPLVTRNYTQIIGLNPGVSQEVNNAGQEGRGGGSSPGNPAGGTPISNGATSVDNNFEMNGLPVNDMQSSAGYTAEIPVPNPDTIQEFRVQTAMYDATSGRDAGAAVDVITRSGTNSLHGTVFEFFRNEDLDANDWFAKRQGQARPVLRQNQYGVTASGPIIKNKLLVFGSYQGTRQLNATDPTNNKLDHLPPLTNDRSAAGLGAVFAGDYGYLGPAFGTIAADGSNIAPQALALFQAKLPNGQYVIPTPQTIDRSKALEIQGTSFLSSPGYFNENQYMINVDYLQSDRSTYTARYFSALSDQESTTIFSTFGFPLFTPERFDVASIGNTYTFSPNLVNQISVGMHRTTSDQNYNNAFTFSSLGMNVDPSINAYPNIDIVDNGFETGTSSALAFLQEEYNAQDSLSWVKGQHRFIFGAGFGYGRDNMEKFNYQGYIFPLTWADFLIGQSYAAYGVPYSNIYESFEGLGDHARDWRYKNGNVFVQDNWSVTKRLTFNLGLRYDRIGDLGEASGRAGNVDVADLDPNPGAGGSYNGLLVASNYKGPAIPTGVIKGSNTFGFNGDGQNTWNPRLGFSWLLPGGNNVLLRGGIGIYHTTPEGQMNLQLSAEQPFGLFSNTAGPANALATDANPFPVTPPLPSFNPYSPTTAYTMDALTMNFRPPTTYHYSLGTQVKMPWGAVLDVTYAGARGLHEILGRSINQAALASPSNPIRGQTTNTVANTALRAPYLGWTTNSMYLFGTDGEAWYNSMQVSLAQQYKHSLQYQAAFTWSSLLSPVPGFTLGSNEFGPSGDQNALRAHESGYGPDPYIRPLRLVFSALYYLPSPARSHAFLYNTLGGWNASTVTVVQDGQQLSLAYSNTTSAYGITTDRPSYAPGCGVNNLPTRGSADQRVNNYVNTSCLTTPAVIGSDGVATGFGDTPNGIIRGPGQFNVDLSLSKVWLLNWPKEGGNLQFRTDFFNATNHPNFAVPNLGFQPCPVTDPTHCATSSGTAFGTITGLSSNPRIIQFAMRFAF